MRLILGTAQIGLNYGIANSTGRPNFQEIDKIFKLCKLSGINYCDTAYAYGNSQEIVKSKGFRVITKLNVSKNFISNLENIINEFDSTELDTILVHNPDKLIEKPHYWEKFKDYVNPKKIKIGVSIYTVRQLQSLLSKRIIPDVIQIPYNIFDRQFESFLPQLKNLGIEVHARSIFLQGLFFLKTNQIPKKLKSLIPVLEEFDCICNHSITEKIKHALHFVLNNQYIDKIVVGVEKPKQLEKLIECYESFSGKIFPIEISLSDTQKAILNPTKW